MLLFAANDVKNTSKPRTIPNKSKTKFNKSLHTQIPSSLANFFIDIFATLRTLMQEYSTMIPEKNKKKIKENESFQHFNGILSRFSLKLKKMYICRIPKQQQQQIL